MGNMKVWLDSLDDDLGTEREWPLVPLRLRDFDRIHQSTDEASNIIKLGLLVRHELEKQQMRAEFAAELARTKSDLERSQSEKHELQIELVETKRYNGELEIENAVLRDRLGVDRKEVIN